MHPRRKTFFVENQLFRRKTKKTFLYAATIVPQQVGYFAFRFSQFRESRIAEISVFVVLELSKGCIWTGKISVVVLNEFHTGCIWTRASSKTRRNPGIQAFPH